MVLGADTSDFVCPLEYKNSLPDLPFDPKLIRIPRNHENLAKYEPSTLEKVYKHELLSVPNLGHPISLVDSEVYKTTGVGKKPLQPEDDQIFKDFEKNRRGGPDRSTVRQPVSWLRKTEYMTADFDGMYYKGKRRDDSAAEQTEKQLSLDECVDGITKQFAEVNSDEELKHSTNPRLYPKAVYRLFPNFTRQDNRFVHVEFRDDPRKIQKLEESEVALEKSGLMIGSGDDAECLLLVPSSLPSTAPSTGDDESEEFQSVREFKVTRPESDNSFVFILDKEEQNATYDVLKERFLLQKKKLQPTAQARITDADVRYKLVKQTASD